MYVIINLVLIFFTHLTQQMTLLKQTVYKKSWSILPKLDVIFPSSTATGRFAHDGAEVDNVGDSIGESDLGLTLSVTADQGMYVL